MIVCTYIIVSVIVYAYITNWRIRKYGKFTLSDLFTVFVLSAFHPVTILIYVILEGDKIVVYKKRIKNETKI